MAELPEREKHEASLAYLLARWQSELRDRLESELGLPPDVRRISGSTWTELEDEAKRRWVDRLSLIFLLAALLHDEAFGFGLASDPAQRRVLEAEARAWAASRASRLASLYTTNTQRRLAAVLQRQGDELDRQARVWIRTGVRAALMDVAGPSRAEAIAINETTEASVAGGEFVANAFSRMSGLTLTAIWRTERDDSVCPICLPLEGVRRDVWQFDFPTGPPAHVRCRCHLDYEVETA